VSSRVSGSSAGASGQPRLRLLRTARPPLLAPALDPEQLAAVTHRGGPLRLLGAPGTGVTTTIVEAVVGRVEQGGLTPDEILVLAPTRRAAAELRERITGRLNRTAREPIARTPASLAFGILRRAAAAEGLPAPRLLSGPEQDVVLRELLAGHAAGAGRAPDWPDDVRAALRTRGLRAELRDLMMRAVERGLGAQDLALLGREHDRPEWVAAAQVLAEYDEVNALGSSSAYDPALIVGAAERALDDDPELLADVRRCARFVAVDDAQEMTPAVARLLATVVGRGGDLLLAGDPDAATLGFRGADPGYLAERADDFAAPGASTPTIVLRTCWRHGPELRAAVERVVARVGTGGRGGQRRATPAPGLPPGQVDVHLLRSGGQEATYLADVLRRAHLQRAVPWSQMAVIVRGSTRAATLRRVLSSSGVPVHVPATEVPVRDESAVRPLLDAFTISLDPARLDLEMALTLLSSPIGGADAVALRRLRRALRAEEREGEGARGSDALLVEAVAEVDRVATLPAGVALPARRVARALAAGRAAAAEDDSTAESVLWSIWAATRLAEQWRRTALAGGPAGVRADRDLDAVVALFDAAARYVDRLPQAGPGEFLEHLRGQEVPGDTLVERAPADDAVELLTPQGAAGRQWRLVVVAGVQVGVWPDTRLRGSLLGSQALVDVLAGRGDGSPEALRSAQEAVRHEELRLFHVAVSRASETLVVTAVSGDDEQPSGLVDLVAGPETDAAQVSSSTDADERQLTRLEPAMSLPSVVAQLRQIVTDDSATQQQAELAATGLAHLAAAGVAGADPEGWHGLAELSDAGPLVPDGGAVRVSPSRVEQFDTCGLRWLLETSGGTQPSDFAQNVGVLVHELASDLPAADRETLALELDRRWPRLGLTESWLSDVQRRRAEDMVTKLASYYDASRSAGRTLVGAELDVAVEIGRAVISGRVDRLDRLPDGSLRVVDLKTGKYAASVADGEVNPQLGVYQLAVQEGAFAGEQPVSAGAELVFIGTTTKSASIREQPPLGGRDNWARELLEVVADGMAGATFEAQEGPHCRKCPARASCPVQPEGRRVTS
jgi:superfamily I DNA/RNA helicase/RecB family exonuclease